MLQILLKKLEVKKNNPIFYFLNSKNISIELNQLLGSKLIIENTGEKYCLHCGKKTKKLYGQGYCYKCFIKIPQADPCVIYPEKCQAHLGISRDMEWSKTHCLIEHYVYLAFTNHLKVGVTRKTQIPSRWIDQGAIKAIKILKTPYRQLAGIIEIELKKHYRDKTFWKKMLQTNEIPSIDFLQAKRNLISILKNEYKKYIELDNTIYTFHYPILTLPKKIYSINLEKIKHIEGTLVAVKGQYLIFDTGAVINIRKHSGFLVKIYT